MVDDGTGADLRERQSGLGLIGMRERVEMLGGQLEVTAQPARGFNIIARIPVAERVAETTR
jgi:signal transduction histidine kinase